MKKLLEFLRAFYEDFRNWWGLYLFFLLGGGLLLAVLVTFGTTLWFKLSEEKVEEERVTVCIQENKEEYTKFLFDCISSLGVEENAYIVDSCDERAIRLSCGHL